MNSKKTRLVLIAGVAVLLSTTNVFAKSAYPYPGYSQAVCIMPKGSEHPSYMCCSDEKHTKVKESVWMASPPATNMTMCLGVVTDECNKEETPLYRLDKNNNPVLVQGVNLTEDCHNNNSPYANLIMIG